MHISQLPNRQADTIVIRANDLDHDPYHTRIIMHATMLLTRRSSVTWEYVTSAISSTLWRNIANPDHTCRVVSISHTDVIIQD